MKEYVKIKDEFGYCSPICTHPLVEKIIDWGSGKIEEDDNIIYYNITVLFKDKSRVDFCSYLKEDDAVRNCNNFLNTIPE